MDALTEYILLNHAYLSGVVAQLTGQTPDFVPLSYLPPGLNARIKYSELFFPMIIRLLTSLSNLVGARISIRTCSLILPVIQTVFSSSELPVSSLLCNQGQFQGCLALGAGAPCSEGPLAWGLMLLIAILKFLIISSLSLYFGSEAIK